MIRTMIVNFTLISYTKVYIGIPDISAHTAPKEVIKVLQSANMIKEISCIMQKIEVIGL